MQRKPRAAGNGSLAQAIALLIHNQAAFLAQLAETNRRFAGGDRRFARIEANLDEIKSVLQRREQMLNDLPEAIQQMLNEQSEAIRQKIGFKRGH